MIQPISRVFKPAERASDCYDWISAEDAVRHALAAFYVACRMCEPPKGEAFVDAQGGAAWSSRSEFVTAFTDHFKDRLARHAHQAGVPDFDRMAEVATMVERQYSPMPVRVHRA